ncbi:MAG: hypothetical protein H3C26_11230 [Rhodocyclaceae bacterium]|nr:hypothetical protein [Rhodocyclaceae bacterium]
MADPAATVAGESGYALPGPHAVAIDDGEWFDAGRGRRLRWRRYRPQVAATAPTPCVVHSHGLGGSRESGADWLAHWASWGIAGVAVQHPGTDADACASDSPLALRHLLRTAVDAAQLAARRHDLQFALDRIAEEAPPAIGLSGHSFGAASALRLIGERRGGDDRPADPRIAAAVLFSPSARGGSLPLAERFAGVAMPCLHLTGSRDDGIGPGDIAAADRRLPFAHMPGPDKYLLSLDGATHPDFAGMAVRPPAPARPGAAALKAVSLGFWRAYLAADAAAAAWLSADDGPLPGVAGQWLRKR